MAETSGAKHVRLWRGVSLLVIAAVLAALASVRAISAPANSEFLPVIDVSAAPEWGGVALLALVLGVLVFAVTTAVVLVRLRLRSASAEAALRDRIVQLHGEADRVHALLLAEPQILVSWTAAGTEPDIVGDVGLVTEATTPLRVLAFGSWLAPEEAQAMEHAVDALRSRGESFAMPLVTRSGRMLEASGRAVGGRAVLRLRDVSGLKGELVDLNARYERLASEMDSLRGLIDALPAPVWARDATGALMFANAAYARAVEAADGPDAVARRLELLERSAREEVLRARTTGAIFTGRLPAVVAGQRRSFDVVDVPTLQGSAGMAFDATAIETMRAELRRIGDAHRRTLDQVATGVAIFGADGRLAFYNTAYRSLWDLDCAFLDQNPTDSAILERLRTAGKLPEERDFREWKAALHEAYRSTESKEQPSWHLPDGRTLRVVTTPNPEGGVTYLFEDVTERLDMARRYDALIRVQGETLDNLGEAVAVISSDGRVRLHNPAFASMWKLDPAVLSQRPHIESVIDWCRALYGDEALWRRLRATATAIEDRSQVSGRLERRDGTVLDLTTVPLPDGATLIAFRDVTDTVNVERALRERNEALEQADLLKVEFVQHVSYELRSPLTNIIGFAHFLGEPSVGPLTSKQREYLGYINASTTALLAIINDILDLATVDAGAMRLNLGSVDIRKTMSAAAEGIRDRLAKDGIALVIDADPDIGSFTADERRVRQVLFNLLANAVGFSPAGSTVTLSAQRQDSAIVLAVTDSGPGIPEEMQDRVFNRFETNSLGSGHRGAGLGLSIVRSFVELHGGSVAIDSEIGRGTTVICTFPLDRHFERSAA